MTGAQDTISFWLNAAGRYPLLPKEEVNRLATIVQAHNPGDKKREKAVEKIVLHNLRLIPGVVRRCVSSKRTVKFGDSSTEDLLQCGVIGLRRAAELFNPTLGYSFSTYAAAWIFQAVQRDLYNNLSMIRVPETTIRELYHAIEADKNYSFNHLEPAKRHRLHDALKALYLCSFDSLLASGEDLEEDRISSVHLNNLNKGSDDNQMEDHNIMPFDAIIGMAPLSEVQKKVLVYTYVENLNQRQVAQLVGLASSTVKKKLEDAQKALSKAMDR